MVYLSEAFRFILYSTVLTAIAATTLYAGVAYKKEVLDPFMAAFIGTTTWSLYLVHRIIKVRLGAITDARLRYWLIRNFRTLLFLVSFLFVSSLLLLLQLNLTWNQYNYLFLFSLVGSWYIIPLAGKALRDVPLIKSILVSTVWTFHLFFFPFDRHLDSITEALEPLSWFLFFYALTIPFDSRDSEHDDRSMKTLPQLIGRKRASTIAVLCIVGFGCTTQIFELTMGNLIIFWSILVLLSLTFVWFIRPKPFIMYSLFDLLMLLLGLSYFIN